MLYPSFLLSRSQLSPCHLIFHIPFGCLDQPHLARDGQTSPITSSNPISDPKIPAHLPQGSCFVSPPHPSTHLVSPTSPHFHLPPAPCSPHSNCRPSCARDTANHHRRSPVTRFFVRYTDSSDRFKPGPPDETLYSDAHVKCSRASGDTLFVLSRRRNPIPFPSGRPRIDNRFFSNQATLCFNAFLTTYSADVLGPSNSSVTKIT